MESFTTVVDGVIHFNGLDHSIYSLVQKNKISLLEYAPRGAKCRTSWALLNKDGGRVLVATITLLNRTNRPIGSALVVSEALAVAGRKGHANRSIGEFIVCRECGSDQFYDLNRSLDYNHHICAGCGATASTLTETGASA